MVEGEDTSLLIVDDDKPFLTRLARAMETRGFVVETADSVEHWRKFKLSMAEDRH